MSIFSQLPNDLVMDIIKLADGGLTTHKGKFNIILQQIIGQLPIYQYEDGAGNTDCPMYVWEEFGCRQGYRSCESSEEEEEEE